MAFHALRDMGYDDEEKYDFAGPVEVEPPDYPWGLQFSVSEEDLDEIGAEDGEPGDTMRFSAIGEVTSVMRWRKEDRVEIELKQIAGEDGDFVDLSQPGHISLSSAELAKLDLKADCERGDTIHLIGEARMESSSDTEWGGKCACLQITHLSAVEDESEESRNG